MGLSEAITLAFTTPGDLEAAGAPPAIVALKNPISEQATVMRTSLVPGLLHAVAHARRHGERSARLFTVGTTFLADESPLPDESARSSEATERTHAPNERLVFAAVLAGERPAWLRKPEGVDVWDAKGIAEGLIRRLVRRDPAVALAGADRPKHLHTRGAAWVDVDGHRVGSLGPLHPDAAEAFEAGGDIVLIEIDLLALVAIGAPPLRFAALPRFPASTRDLAVVVRDGVPAGDVERAVRKAAGDLGESVGLFDRFVGGAVPAGHASLALHVVYRAPDRTLTDAEVDQRHAQVVAEVEREFGAQLRS
jgi:phenylalanyl-tRNA synthetase beta chain